VIYDGGSRGEAARTNGVGRQTVWDRALRFNAGGPDGLIDGTQAALAAAIETGPIPAANSVLRWCLVDPGQWSRDEFAVSIRTQTLGGDLRHHAQNAGAIPALQKLPRPGDSDPGGTPMELSWQDEARVGQKNGTTRRRSKHGTQLSAARDERTSSV
jgi:hypothetical protein